MLVREGSHATSQLSDLVLPVGGIRRRKLDLVVQVLVGDSAHAPNHSSGQGVSLAGESAVELARCLRDIDEPTAAFAAYEQLRRPRVSRIAAQAARTNQHKSAGPIQTAVMSLFMRIASRTFMKPEKMFGWVQGYRISWDEPVRGPLIHARPSGALALSS